MLASAPFLIASSVGHGTKGISAGWFRYCSQRDKFVETPGCCDGCVWIGVFVPFVCVCELGSLGVLLPVSAASPPSRYVGGNVNLLIRRA